jgi:hypothetical protein
MPIRSYKPKQIVTLLRQFEIEIANGSEKRVFVSYRFRAFRITPTGDAIRRKQGEQLRTDTALEFV